MIVPFPPTKANRLRLAQAFRRVPRVDLSIDCVIEGQMGEAFVDDVDRAAVFKIETGPFAYLAGDPGSPAAPDLLRSLAPGTLLMPSAPGWAEAARAMYGEQWIELDRHRFSAEGLDAAHLSRLRSASRFAGEVKRMGGSLVASVWGQEHFIDLAQYESPDDFLARGIGFHVDMGGRTAGAAFASLVCSRGIEVSVYVVERYRRAGMATVLSAALLLWCLENDLDPHWDAANAESFRLAVRLGYRPLGSYRALYLDLPV